MAHAYKAVGWNRQKRVYDSLMLLGVVAYLGLFIGASLIARPNATLETILIRAFGTGALVLLHVILSIGPLSRLDRRFLPLLYNRRHLGVTMFLLALAHGAFSIIQFHALGELNPLVSVLTSNGRWGSVAQFPFQPLGLAALVIVFLMAATSHDFWLANLSAPVWKALHMLIYPAYAIIIAHVALGALQSERDPVLASLLALGVVWIASLHLVAGLRERRADSPASADAPSPDGFVDVCGTGDIEDGRGRTFVLSGERVAVFRYDGKISALSNACQHQNGPLGEGRVIRGCVVCPWHGYEYNPENGSSPPPFTEKVPTFRTMVKDGRVLVHPTPNQAGTPTRPAVVPGDSADPTEAETP